MIRNLNSVQQNRSVYNTRLSLLVCACVIVTCGWNTARATEGRWSKQFSGSLVWLRAVHFIGENRGWAVGGNGALLSTINGGKTWRGEPRPTEDAIRDMFFSSATTGWIVCERSIHAVVKDEPRSYLLHTTDGGATWQRVDIPELGSEVKLSRIVFADENHGWTFGDLGVIYTTADAGKTWTGGRLRTGRLLLGAFFLNPLQGWIVGARTTLLRTTDGGTTWNEGTITTTTTTTSSAPSSSSSGVMSQDHAAPRLNAVVFVDERRGWVVGAGGSIFATTDGGRSWQPQTSSVRSDLLDVRFISRTEGFAVGADGIIVHTKNSGATWHRDASGTTLRLERLFFANPGSGWAVGFGGAIIRYATGVNN